MSAVGLTPPPICTLWLSYVNVPWWYSSRIMLPSLFLVSLFRKSSPSPRSGGIFARCRNTFSSSRFLSAASMAITDLKKFQAGQALSRKAPGSGSVIVRAEID